MSGKLYVVDIGYSNVGYPWTCESKEELREGLIDAIELDGIDPEALRIFVIKDSKDFKDDATVKVIKPCVSRKFKLKSEFMVYE